MQTSRVQYIQEHITQIKDDFLLARDNMRRMVDICERHQLDNLRQQFPDAANIDQLLSFSYAELVRKLNGVEDKLELEQMLKYRGDDEGCILCRHIRQMLELRQMRVMIGSTVSSASTPDNMVAFSILNAVITSLSFTILIVRLLQNVKKRE
jgi:hypothetical protein